MTRRFQIAVLIFLIALATPFTAIWPATATNILAQSRAIAHSSPQDIEPAALATVSEHLQKQLTQSDGPVSFLAILKEQSEPNIFAAQHADGQTRVERAAVLYAHLTAEASHSQAGLLAWLDSRGIPYRAYYIVNMLEVYGDDAVVQALRTRPELDRLVANPVVNSIQMLGVPAGSEPGEPTDLSAYLSEANSPYQDIPNTGLDADLGDSSATVATPYGISYINAPQVWAKGYRGQGIVVAGQDTGVQWDHPALRDSYRGWNESNAQATHVYNWYDAWDNDSDSDPCTGNAQIPCDDNGHGTHTLGTAVGYDSERKLAVGLAPDAQWIGWRNMLRGVGTPASYMACFEFFLAPYPQDGDPFTDGRPELAPNIINNSWGCPPNEGCDPESLRQVVETVRAAGQFVVSSAGNYGAGGCETVRDPIAIYDAAFSIGAHDANGNIASFSSRGPVTIDDSNHLKPDITAPGVNVLSAYPANQIHNSSEPYTSLSGTSMAAPHMAGAVALLWSAAPHLIGAIDETEQILLKSATPVLDNRCGEGDAATSPNYTYGFGRLDALAAMEMGLRPWSAEIEVVDGQGAPVAGTQVTLVDTRTGFRYVMTTDSNGQASLPQHAPHLYDGTYELHIGPDGAATKVTDVQLNQDESQAGQEFNADGLTVRYQIERPEEEEEDPLHIYYFPIIGS